MITTKQFIKLNQSKDRLTISSKIERNTSSNHQPNSRKPLNYNNKQ